MGVKVGHALSVVRMRGLGRNICSDFVPIFGVGSTTEERGSSEKEGPSGKLGCLPQQSEVPDGPSDSIMPEWELP